MSDEQKGAAAPVSTNVDAEKDVQNVLAELKAEEAVKSSEQELAETKDEKPAEQPVEDPEEARIVAEAAKLGKESEKTETKSASETQRDSRGGRSNRQNNNKFDPSTLKETDDPVEIRKQVEFYFSDSNLPMDKFLLSKVGGSANKPVPLSLLHSFKRMRRFQPFSAIVEALKSSDILELTDNDTAVRRKVPLPESVSDAHDPTVVKVFEDKAMSRSIYAKGFGPEEPSTQFDIEAFFAPYGPTNAIRLRRAADKVFKGSVFVEFDSEETQKKFLALDPKPKWKGQDLLIKSKKDYCEEKVRDIEAGRIKPNRGRGGYRGRGRGGRRDNRDWKERKSEDRKRGFDRKDRNDRNGVHREDAPRREVQKDSRGVPVVQSTVDNKETPKEADTVAGQKRAREDGEPSANGDHPAKKVAA